MVRLTRRTQRNPDGPFRPPRYREFIVKKAVAWALGKTVDTASSFVVGVLTVWAIHVCPWISRAAIWTAETAAWLHAAVDCWVGC
jgi:hypothetical protein